MKRFLTLTCAATIFAWTFPQEAKAVNFVFHQSQKEESKSHSKSDDSSSKKSTTTKKKEKKKNRHSGESPTVTGSSSSGFAMIYSGSVLTLTNYGTPQVNNFESYTGMDFGPYILRVGDYQVNSIATSTTNNLTKLDNIYWQILWSSINHGSTFNDLITVNEGALNYQGQLYSLGTYQLVNGQLTTVPEPVSAWLLASGLGLGLRRRRS